MAYILRYLLFFRIARSFLAIALAVMVPSIGHTANFYCCKDDDDRKVCGDFIPSVCKNRAYRIVNAAGVTIREIAAPLTVEEQAQLAAEKKRKKEEEEARRTQVRKDQALLSSYSDVNDIDSALQRNEEEAQRIIKVIEDEILTLKVRKQTMLDEAKLRSPDKTPPDTEARINSFNRQILEQEGLIEQQQKNIAGLRERFAEEKRRYLELIAASKQ